MLQSIKKCWFALIATALAACAGQSSSGSEQVGMLKVPLVSTGTGGTHFALAGTFDLVGPETISVTVQSTDPDFTTADVVSMMPRVGSYNLTLSGWKIYAMTGNPAVPTVVTGAQLLNAATLPVSIVSEQTATVVYRFAVPGSGTVVFSNGKLNIDFTVAEGFPDGTACTTGSDCQSKVCGADQTCSAASCSDGVQNGMETSPDCGGGCSCNTGGTTADAGSAPATTIFTIVLENQDYNEVVGSANAPYINSLIASGALATNYLDSGHPALPNYLFMISGAAQYPGFVDMGPTQAPYFPANAQHLGSQMQAAGIPWRSYQESMGTACALSASGSYTPEHDPFLYFSDIQESPDICKGSNVDYSMFASDLAAGSYRYMFITPNLSNDGHNPTNDPMAALKQSDSWCSTEIPKILASDTYQNGGVIFLTWSQAENRNGDSPDQVPMIVLSPRLKSAGYKSNASYDHGSYLATVEDLLGLGRLSTVATKASMKDDFFKP